MFQLLGIHTAAIIIPITKQMFSREISYLLRIFIHVMFFCLHVIDHKLENVINRWRQHFKPWKVTNPIEKNSEYNKIEIKETFTSMITDND